MFCFENNKTNSETTDKIFVPVVLRVSLTQRIHLEAQTGHIGLKETLTKIRESYVCDEMARDVDKVLCCVGANTVRKFR